MPKAVLFDSVECVGCRMCEEACAKRWNLPYDDTIAQQEKLSRQKLTTIQTVGDRYSRVMCMHCADPTCDSVCPVGALKKTELGPVVYEERRCIGCRYCMLACPFNVPVYEWDKRLPRVSKCDMCHDRLKAGKPTTCSEACPTGASLSGERDELLAEAQRRIREKPEAYHASIYGLSEVGGTNVLMIGAVPMEQLGMPAGLGPDSLPVLTWRVLEHVPNVVTLGSVLLGGVWWITQRREQVARAEGRGGNGRKS